MGFMNPSMVRILSAFLFRQASSLQQLTLRTGSAPDISGKGIVNPVAAILSMSMLLKYSLCMPDLAKAVDDAVKIVIDKGIRTADIGGTNSTVDVGDAVASELAQILRGQKSVDG